MIKYLDKLNKIFSTKSKIHLFIVFLVFGLSGSLSVFLSEPFLNFIKIDELVDNKFLLFMLRVLIIFPIYQIVLLFIATLFGQFTYFWNFQKKSMNKILKKK